MSLSKLDRRVLLQGAIAGGALAIGKKIGFAQTSRDVPWLTQVQTAPAKIPGDAPPLSALLKDSTGSPIKTAAQWKLRADELRKKWLEFLGPAPAERTKAPAIKVVEEETVGNVVRKLIQYDVAPGATIEAYLLSPLKPAGKCPAAAVFHSTVNHTIRQPAGLGEDIQKAFGLKLTERGFVTISPRNFLWTADGKSTVRQETDKFLQQNPGTTGMRRMLHDSQVAVDILLSLPEVDAARICSVGHSLGAKEVLYLAAFDDRVKVTVSSEGGIGMKFSNWEAPWYLGSAIKAQDFPREHHELLGLIAPRPFLLVGGDSADGDRGWPFIEAALPVYKLFGEPARLGQYNHKKGHAVPPEAEKHIYEWIETYA